MLDFAHATSLIDFTPVPTHASCIQCKQEKPVTDMIDLVLDDEYLCRDCETKNFNAQPVAVQCIFCSVTVTELVCDNCGM